MTRNFSFVYTTVFGQFIVYTTRDLSSVYKTHDLFSTPFLYATRDLFREMVLPTMTCFEPETKGQLVEGTQFHQFMFESSSKYL